MKAHLQLICTLFVCLVHGEIQAAAAMPADAQAPETPDVANTDPIEEIQITGQRSSISLRVEIKHAEEAMFEQFNDLNSSKLFDVSCGNKMVTGSLIPAWECVPVYMKRAFAQNTQDFLQLGILPKTEAQLWFENRPKHEEFNAEIRAVAMQNPDFARAIFALNEKKKRLEELEQEQRKSGLNGFLSRLLKKDPE